MVTPVGWLIVSQIVILCRCSFFVLGNTNDTHTRGKGIKNYRENRRPFLAGPYGQVTQPKRIYLSTTQGGQFLRNSDLINWGVGVGEYLSYRLSIL